MSETQTDRLTIYADYVCPFCYLGHASLDQYRETRESPLEIDWQPFDLRSGKRGPDGEIDHEADDSEGRSPSGSRTQSDDGKDDEYFEQARQNVRRLKEEYGVEMSQEIAREVDSLPAQAASLYVRENHPEQWAAFDDAIYAALWKEGRDIGNRDVLADICEEIGLDPDEVLDAIEDEELRARLDEQFAVAQQRGVTGVPTFVYEGQAARGAVPPEQLKRLVEGV